MGQTRDSSDATYARAVMGQNEIVVTSLMPGLLWAKHEILVTSLICRFAYRCQVHSSQTALCWI